MVDYVLLQTFVDIQQRWELEASEADEPETEGDND